MNARTLLLTFASKWETKYGRRYQISWAKETSQLKRLLATYSADELVQLMDVFFSEVDSFAIRAGHTVGVFVGTINRLAVRLSELEASKAKAKERLSDWERLEEARRAGEPK